MKNVMASASVIVCALMMVGARPERARSQRNTTRPRPSEHFRGHEVAGGEVLVRLRSTAAVQDIRTLTDAEDDRPLGFNGWRRVRSASRGVEALIAALTGHPEVLEAEPNYLFHTTT